MTTKPITVTIDCPCSHPSGWSCADEGGALTVEVSGPGPEYEIVRQTCCCDPLAIDSSAKFWTEMERALGVAGEASR